MTEQPASIVICGAGIAGVSAAYHLAVRHAISNIVLVDEHPPLSLTSDKSTECYRNWWPGPGDAMVRLMNRSIDLLEELADLSGNAFNLNRRGYLYASADPARIAIFQQAAEEAASLGAGPLRIHRGAPGEPAYQPSPAEGYQDLPSGADLITDQTLIRKFFPYLAPETVAVLHARRCGWLSAQQLGMVLLEAARAHGVRLVQARLSSVELEGGAVRAVRLEREGKAWELPTQRLVIAAGPFTQQVAAMLGVELPLQHELHAKISFQDTLLAVPREAPLLIWTDPQRLPWTDEERALLAEEPEHAWLLEETPAGVHGRPEGPTASPVALMLWTYDTQLVEPVLPPQLEEALYPEVTLRGWSAMLPALKGYFERLPKPTVDGGYYAKTPENRPLIGPLPIEGAYLLGALSGFGIMASQGAAELLALHLTGGELPEYAPWFLLERYQDPQYQALLENWGSSGQL